MKRYEDNDFPTIVLFFVASCILAVLCVGGLVVAKWVDVIGIGMPEETTWTGNRYLIGGSLCLIFLWFLYDRPRLIADRTGNVWVRNGGCGVARFNWSEVVRWRVDVEQICLDVGIDVSRTIVVELASDRVLRINDCHQRFVRAFREHVPNREIVEQGIEHGAADNAD